MFSDIVLSGKQILFLLIFILLSSCRPQSPAPDYQVVKSAFASEAMVVSAHPLATRVGVEILKNGGNAVDAAVAVQFALAVVYPRAGNIGGGGFMLIRTKDGESAALDYRERAPAQGHRDMYLDTNGEVVEGLSTAGHLAVGVPGTVDGLVKAHEKYGQIRDFATLVAPAITLAAEGFAITSSEAERLNTYKEQIARFNEPGSVPFLQQKPWKAGDWLIQADLSQTLKRIADRGRPGFYAGRTADLIVREMQSGGGLITHEDLEGYHSKWRAPLTGEYKDYKIIAMPPPSSGGVALLQLLHLVEDYPLRQWGFQSVPAIHLMVEAERRAYADRAHHMGDTDYFPVPIDSLLNRRYLQQRMADFDTARATVSSSILAGNFLMVKEQFETTHTSIIDAQGNAVSLTTTLNSNYGSKVVVDGAGFFLNNEMDDFSAKPGVPNQFGLVGAEANAIEPGKRMLSSMTPTIIEKDGEVALVLGAPGGSTIITAVFQVMLNVLEFGMPLEEAVQSRRFHHQWLPDKIMVEKGGLDANTIEKLRSMGHDFQEVEYMAIVKAIQVLPDGELNGVGDPRNPDDHAEGL